MIYKLCMYSMLLCNAFAVCSSFEEQWKTMQSEFAQLYDAEERAGMAHLVQQIWQRLRQPIIAHVQGNPDPNFLKGPIAGTMVTDKVSKDSLHYVTQKASIATKEKLHNFEETDFGGLARICQQLNCSADSLRHMYFAARMLDNAQGDIQRVVELGGGYGCLARILKMALPDLTYIIIDLPEVLALQSLFLRGSLPNIKVKVHVNSIPKRFTKGVIHLVPYYFLPTLDIKNADAFVSIVALSETSEVMQNYVINKHFFNAPLCYIMGQKQHPELLNQSNIVDNIKKLYLDVTYSTYTHFYQGLYEIMAKQLT